MAILVINLYPNDIGVQLVSFPYQAGQALISEGPGDDGGIEVQIDLGDHTELTQEQARYLEGNDFIRKLTLRR